MPAFTLSFLQEAQTPNGANPVEMAAYQPQCANEKPASAEYPVPLDPTTGAMPMNQ